MHTSLRTLRLTTGSPWGQTLALLRHFQVELYLANACQVSSQFTHSSTHGSSPLRRVNFGQISQVAIWRLFFGAHSVFWSLDWRRFKLGKGTLELAEGEKVDKRLQKDETESISLSDLAERHSPASKVNRRKLVRSYFPFCSHLRASNLRRRPRAGERQLLVSLFAAD